MMNRIDTWIQSPERSAAGRLGIYRILFSAYYLIVLSMQNHMILGDMPASGWRPIWYIKLLPGIPSPVAIGLVEIGLVVGLVFLMFGLVTRPATFVVLVTGLFLGGLRYSFGKVDHADAFLVVIIPAVCLFSRWGDTFSVDAILQRRRNTGESIDVHDSSWVYGWPIKAILLVLTILFFTAALMKMKSGWLQYWDYIAVIIPTRAARNWMLLPITNPVHVAILAVPYMTVAMQVGALIFEGSWPLALVNRSWRNFYAAMGVLFHVFNLLYGYFDFIEMLIVYAIFVDWMAVKDWVSQRLGSLPDRAHRFVTARPVLLAIGAAALMGALWNSPVTPRYPLIILNALVWPIAAFGALAVLVRLGMGMRSTRPKVAIGRPAHHEG